MWAQYRNQRHALLVLYLTVYSVLANGTELPDLYIMGFLPMTGTGWPGGGACLPAVKIAVELANERTDILADYNIRYVYKDTKCDPGYAANGMYEMLYEPPVKHFISGPGCSIAAEATARSSHMWNLTHIAWAAASPLLSNQAKYPRFFRIIPNDAFYNTAKVALLRRFNWRKVAIISVALDYFFAVTDDLIRRTKDTDIQIITQEIFNGDPTPRVARLKVTDDLIRRTKDTDIQIITQEIFNGDPTPRVARLKELDARIIFANGYEDHARQILCAAYKAGLYGDKIVWFFPEWYSTYWWRLPGVTCTRDEMDDAAHGILQTGRFSEPSDKENVGSAGINFIQFQELFYGHVLYRPELVAYDKIAGSCFDSAWGAILALNCTNVEMKKRGHVKTLAEFTYADTDIADIVTWCTNNLDFVGMVGRTDLTHRDAEQAVRISQVFDKDEIVIGRYDKHSGDVNETEWNIRWINGGIKWRGGFIPHDSTEVKVVEVTVPAHLYAVMSSLASFGIILSLSLIVFNVYYRANTFVKLSSPNINTILLLGCVCTYSTVFMQSYTSETILLCRLRCFTFTIGFSTAFGALFSKTWRVYRIFSNKQLQILNIKDRQLIGIVGAVLGVLISVLILKQITDPLYIATTFLESEVYLVGIDEEIRPYISRCESRYESYFSWTLYSIEGVLLIFGAFLSFETRRVKIAALNDSRLIGLCLYTVVVLAAICLTLNLALDTDVALIYGITSGFIIFSTTATQLIVFIPKMTAVFYPHHIEPDGVIGKSTGMTNIQPSKRQTIKSVSASGALTPREATA